MTELIRIWPHQVPYLPFLERTPENLGSLPSYVRPHIHPGRILPVPAAVDMDDPLSILRLYISDLEWVILPEAHRDREGYTFTNLSYYSGEERPQALSEQVGDLCRSQLSIGMVRVIAGLAHAVWHAIVPLSSSREAAPLVRGAPDLAAMTTRGASVDSETFTRIIRRYPRLSGLNPDLDQGGYETEYLLFADMLRFAWCHEWFHGMAGHTTFMRDRHGLHGMDEISDAMGSRGAALLRRAMEFQADALSLDLLLDQIFMGEDLPTNLIDLSFSLGDRLSVLILALCTLTVYWTSEERALQRADRLHPPIPLRYLRFWDMLRSRLIIISDLTALRAVAGFTSSIFALGEQFPAFYDFRMVTPVLVETHTMKDMRSRMQKYQSVLANIQNEVKPFVLDYGYRDAFPVQDAPLAGDVFEMQASARAAAQEAENLAFWLQVPDADKARVAAHFPSLFSDRAEQQLETLDAHYRLTGNDQMLRSVEASSRLLAEFREQGAPDFAFMWQLLGATGPSSSRLADYMVRGIVAESSGTRDSDDA